MAVHETHWPHIPAIQWELISWWNFNLFWIEFWISNTVLSTWIFMVFLIIVAIMFKISIRKNWWFFKNTWLIVVGWLYKLATDFIGDKRFAKRVIFLTGWMFIFIFLSNVFSLFLDWMILVANPELWLYKYLRPINSDPNTTFALSLSIIVISHFVAVFKKWIPQYLKWYIFNFSGHDLFEKFINVFLGWLHFIWEIVKALSLSLRLFWNIFAWVVLISMLAFLGWMVHIYGLKIWEIFVLPFWFFELFVALIQAVVFFVLASIYFKQALEEHH